jgi:hypothetical protein
LAYRPSHGTNDAVLAGCIVAGGPEEKVLVAEYRVRLPREERIKERLEAFGQATDDA